MVHSIIRVARLPCVNPTNSSLPKRTSPVAARSRSTIMSNRALLSILPSDTLGASARIYCWAMAPGAPLAVAETKIPLPTAPDTRSGVLSMAIGSRCMTSAPFTRENRTRMSKRARKARLSSGRATVLLGRRPSVSASAVPGAMSNGSTTAAVMPATRFASAPPTPARSSAWARPSPCPSEADRSRLGLSGVPVSVCTASVAPMCRPLSPPHASGAIDWARASS